MSGEDELNSRLVADGFTGWADAVQLDRVDRALTAIHRNLGQCGLHPDRLLEFEQSSYCPELRSDPDILALFEGTRLQAEAERLLGPLEPVTYAQIALRFPRSEPPHPPHLDGVAAPHNGVPEGTIKTFSALAGVYLSEVRAGEGAFTVLPGSHLAHAAYFAQHGPASLLEGMPVIDPIEPVAIVGNPGFGFLAHYLVGHGIGVHRGPGIRYAVFFRLRSRGHSARGRRTMVDPWLEWQL